MSASDRNRVPALDGIRGAAVILILLSHVSSSFAGARGAGATFRLILAAGWCGVDLFFVLSGFLITGILIGEKRMVNYFRRFYWRRVLRILPLYYAVLVAYLIVIPFLSSRFGFRNTFQGAHSWQFFLYVQNLFVLSSPLDPRLSILWSLAVEEQFYLLWPAVVRRSSLETLLKVCAFGVPLAALLRSFIAFHGAAAWGYSNLPTRMDSILIGAVCALAAQKPEWRRIALRFAPMLGILSLVGFAAIVWQKRVLAWEDPVTLTFAPSCFGFLFGWLILHLSAFPESRLSALFSNGILRSFGMYSYAIYILHWSLKMAMQKSILPRLFRWPAMVRFPAEIIYIAVFLLLCWCVGWLSWKLFERHFLKLKNRGDRRREIETVSRTFVTEAKS